MDWNGSAVRREGEEEHTLLNWRQGTYIYTRIVLGSVTVSLFSSTHMNPLHFARFGKILWKNMPEDMLQCNWGFDKFADLCFSDTKHSTIFTTE